MSARILTYRSVNADPDKQWLALIEHSKEGTVWITFMAPTEDEVKAKVRRFWQREKAKGEEMKARSNAKSPRHRAAPLEDAHG